MAKKIKSSKINKPSPNDQRSDVKNNNNSAFEKDRINQINQRLKASQAETNG